MPSRVGIATMHLAVRAQPEPAEDYETGRFRGHLESQNVPIKWQQVIQVFAPDACSAQPCDHRGGPSWRPLSAVRSNAALWMRGIGRWVRGEDHPTSIATRHIMSKAASDRAFETPCVTPDGAILSQEDAPRLSSSRTPSVWPWLMRLPDDELLPQREILQRQLAVRTVLCPRGGACSHRGWAHLPNQKPQLAPSELQGTTGRGGVDGDEVPTEGDET